MLFTHSLTERLGECRHDVEQVANNAKTRHSEDRGFRVLVDGYDDLTGAHPGLVLDGTGDTAGDIQVG